MMTSITKEEIHKLLNPMKVIGLGGNPQLNEKVASTLGVPFDRNDGSPLQRR